MVYFNPAVRKEGERGRGGEGERGGENGAAEPPRLKENNAKISGGVSRGDLSGVRIRHSFHAYRP